MKYDPHKSSLFDLDANIVAMLVYLIPLLATFLSDSLQAIVWIVPLFALVMESKSDFVNYHAANSLAFFAINAIIYMISIALNLTAVLSGWIANIPILGIFYGGISILIIVIVGIVFALLNICLFAAKIISLIKAYSYQDIHLPVISHITDFILSLKHH